MGKLALNINKKAWEAGRKKFAEGFDSDAEMPDGRYNGKIVKVDIVDAKDEQQLVFRVRVPEANDGAGGILSAWFNLTNEERIVWTFRILEKLGYDPSQLDPKDLENVIAEIEKNQPEVRVRVKTQGQYTNISIDRVLSTSSEESTPTDAPAEEEAVEEKPAPAAKKEAAKPAAAKTTKAPEPEPAAEDEEVVEEAEPAAAEEEVEIKPGMKLKATIQGELVDVTIVEVHEAEQKVTVERKSDKKKFKVAVSKLVL